MEDKIVNFIKKQTCASICCVDKNGNPYCFSCFYAFNSDKGLLYYKSSATTFHSSIIGGNPVIAGTILPDKLNRLAVKGLQFEGVVLSADHPFEKDASTHYLKKYPFALMMPGITWTIQINSIKMTDNTISFGNKTSWERITMVAGN